MVEVRILVKEWVVVDLVWVGCEVGVELWGLDEKCG